VQVRSFGKSALRLPVIGMGTWQTFDVDAKDEPAPAAVAAAAYAAGTRVFDTSPMYARSEAVLGRALANVRSSAFVATKIWTPDAAVARAQLDAQLEAFGGHIDLEQVHNLVAWRDHLPMLEAAKADGLISLIGATHYRADAFPDLEELMNTGRLDSIQVPYSPYEPEAEQRILPLAEELGLGIVVMRPFGDGKFLPGPPSSVLEKAGWQDWPTAVLRWILADPRVHVVIPATSSVEHARANALAGDAPPLTSDERGEIARLAREWAA
jgi:aryl-alcohol dehydrogenase-like predicted oxidoreductase